MAFSEVPEKKSSILLIEVVADDTWKALTHRSPCHLCVSRQKLWDTLLLSVHHIFLGLIYLAVVQSSQKFSADHAAAVCKQQLHFTLGQVVF